VYSTSTCRSVNLNFGDKKIIDIKDFKVNAGWEKKDGRIICRWIMVWNDIDGDKFAGALGGYGGGGAFYMEQFYAKHSGGVLTNLMIDIEDKVTSEEIDFFDDVPSDVLAVCDDAQDIVMKWHDQDEWEDDEQLILLDKRLDELTISDDMYLLAQGTSAYIKNILELAGITAAPI